jgi:hypothetical protein
MRNDLNVLDRVLVALEKELVDASDDEIAEAAADLGMDLKMKGSAAFVGVLHSRPRRVEDIFELESLRWPYGHLPDRHGDDD